MIRVSVAPMMDRTDRHYRWFLRQITRDTLLYTEMITARAIRHGDRDRLLSFDAVEHPISIQLGGDDPAELASAARVAVDAGYDEVNLNVGCPSDRVQAGRFGACLMAHPAQVADCVTAIREAVPVEVTVKHRIGIDDMDSYEHMLGFVDVVARAGCKRFSVHARKAWLTGLSPKENRTVPPLRYDDVYRLKRERPDLDIEINGGVTTVAQVMTHLEHVDAVMIGRAAYDDPWLMAEVARAALGESLPSPDRLAVVQAVAERVTQVRAAGESAWPLLRHLHGLFHGQPGARAWKAAITQAGRTGEVAPIREYLERGRAREASAGEA